LPNVGDLLHREKARQLGILYRARRHGNADHFSTAAGGGIAGTPLGTPVGGRFDAFVMRSQFAF